MGDGFFQEVHFEWRVVYSMKCMSPNSREHTGQSQDFFFITDGRNVNFFFIISLRIQNEYAKKKRDELVICK